MIRTIAILALTSSAQAQMLDLSGPRTPEPGDGQVAMRIARELLAESAELAEGSSPEARASASIRRAAARAITTGDATEPEGSAITLFGLTLRAHFESLDALIAHAPPHTAAGITADLDQLIADSPADVRAWEHGLMLALSPLISAPADPGWQSPGHDAGYDSSTDLTLTRERLDEAGLDAASLDRIDAHIDASEMLGDWPSFGPSIRHESNLIASAARAVVVDDPWLTPAVRERWLSDMSLALRTPRTAERLLRLRVLGLDADLFDRLSALPRDAVSRDVRDRFIAGIAGRADPPEQTLRTLPRAIEVLDRAAKLESLPHERTLARELWPMYRVLVPEARSRGASAKESAVLLATDAAGATDPGVLSSLARFESHSDMLEGLLSLSDRLRGENGRVPIELEGVAARLKAIGSDAHESRDPAFHLFGHCLEQRALVDEIGALIPVVLAARPGEGELVAHANSARALWTSAWSVPGGAGLSEQQLARVRGVRRLLMLIADASASREGAQALAAWELTPEAASILSEGMEDALRRLIRRAIAGTSSAGEISSFESRYAIPLLAGRLSRLMGRSERSIGEIAFGPPPPGSALAEEREQLASVCRYAIELESPGIEGVRAYIDSLAKRQRGRLPLLAADRE